MKWRYAAPPLALVAVLAAAAPFAWPQLTRWWWERQAPLPLDEDEAAALRSCEDPGWVGLVRVLHQDLDADCPPDGLSGHVAAHLDGSQHREWVQQLAEDPGAPPRSRLRAGMALLAAGHTPVRDLSLVVSHPSVPEDDRAHVIRRLVSGDLDGTWADPLLWTEVSAWRLAEGDLEAAAPVVGRLRVEALDSGLDPEHRAWLSRLALDAAGYPEWIVDQHSERRDRGLPEQLPAEVARVAARIESACSEEHTPPCLRLAAHLLEEASSEAPMGERPTPAPQGVATPLWSLLYDGEQEATHAAMGLTAAVGAWVARAPEGDRGWRLLGAVTARPADPIALRADPVQALLHRRAGPWTTALATLAVADVAGAAVQVQPWDRGVLLVVDGLPIHVDHCGRRADVTLAPEVALDPWPARAVLARAAAEAATHPAEGARSLALAHLAERLDPLGVQGLVDRIAAARPEASGPEGSLGRRAGSLLALPPPQGPQGAEARRAELAATAGRPPSCD